MNYKVGDIVSLEIFAEDDGYYIIYNHFDCPICNTKYSSSDCYHELESDDVEIVCENCNSQFNKVSNDWYDDCKVKIVSIGNQDVVVKDVFLTDSEFLNLVTLES